MTEDFETVKLHYLRQLLQNFLEPKDIIDDFPEILWKSEGIKIMDSTALMREERVDIFIKFLLNEQRDNSKIFRQFLKVLGDHGSYDWLVPLLDGECECDNFIKSLQVVETIDEIKSIMPIIYRTLKVINPVDILPYMREHLTEEDREEVENIATRKTKNQGLFVLINKLLIKEPNWISTFVQAVSDLNYTMDEKYVANYGCSSLGEVLTVFLDCFPNAEIISSQPNPDVEMTFTDNPEQLNEKYKSFKQMDVNALHDIEDESGSSQKHGKDYLDVDDYEDVIPSKRPKSSSDSPITAEEEVCNKSASAWKLRNYQEELCEKALAGENVIICAPTASGKTLVAAAIIKNHMEKGGRKAAFFAPTNGLVKQQHRKLDDYLPEIRKRLIYAAADDRDPQFDVKSQIYANDLMVMTPQTLANSIEDKTVDSIFDFSLLIFDECHHTRRYDPYSLLLYRYLREKNEGSKKIQIIGLTATLGIGQSRNLEEAMEHIIMLCGNLDARGGVISVRNKQNKADLERRCPGTAEETISIEYDDDNPLKNKLRELVDKTIDLAEEIGAFVKIFGIKKPSEDIKRDHTKFENWCTFFQTCAGTYDDKLNKTTTGRDTRSCSEVLKMLNSAVDMCKVCRPEDAINTVSQFIDTSFKTSSEKNTKVEMRLHEMLQGSMKMFGHCLRNPKSRNKNLNIIEDIIMQTLVQDPDSQVMLMVPKRIYAIALKNWMNETTDRLKSLNAEVFIGVGNRVTSDGKSVPGLKHAEQERILKGFNDGKVKAILCTPDAAGEGMDIENCNLVINYDFLKNEISKVQTSGRARKENSKVVQLSSARVESRESLTVQKVLMMHKATREVEKLQRKNPEEYENKLEVAQKKIISYMLLAEARKNLPVEVDREKNYKILCRKCSTEICMTSDIIRLNKCQYVFHVPDLKNKYIKREHLKKGMSCGPGMKKLNKIHCVECNREWGIIVSWNGFLVPVMKALGFKYVDPTNSSGFALQPRKWRDLKVAFKDFEIDSITENMVVEFLEIDLSY